MALNSGNSARLLQSPCVLALVALLHCGVQTIEHLVFMCQGVQCRSHVLVTLPFQSLQKAKKTTTGCALNGGHP